MGTLYIGGRDKIIRYRDGGDRIQCFSEGKDKNKDKGENNKDKNKNNKG